MSANSTVKIADLTRLPAARVAERRELGRLELNCAAAIDVFN
jgi:hypothetical protein